MQATPRDLVFNHVAAQLREVNAIHASEKSSPLSQREREQEEETGGVCAAWKWSQLIVNCFADVAVFFGSVSSSTPSLYFATAFESSTGVSSQSVRLEKP